MDALSTIFIYPWFVSMSTVQTHFARVTVIILFSRKSDGANRERERDVENEVNSNHTISFSFP